MSRQDKATIERFSSILRELVKKPENRLCADCKKNDPRWASWNLGVFLCIRCSGIHRGMGTHISKVKSVDLDTWTPEQMESIQKWGNRLANLYWEALLKPGHVPPEHKIESFIRSKYELRKWVRGDKPPVDPRSLDNNPSQSQAQHKTSRYSPVTVQVNSLGPSSASSQPQSHSLLSSNFSSNANSSHIALKTTSIQPPVQTLSEPLEDGFFSLDFHNPSMSLTSTGATNPTKQDVKQDILSLFSSTSPNTEAFGQSSTLPGYPWNTTQVQKQQQSSTDSANSALGGGTCSGYSGFPTSFQVNPWCTSSPALSQQHSRVDISGSSSTRTLVAPRDVLSTTVGTSNTKGRKDEAFGEIWR